MNRESLSPITRTACVVCRVIFTTRNTEIVWTAAEIPKKTIVIGSTVEECEEISKHLGTEKFKAHRVEQIESWKYKSFSYPSSEKAIDVFIAPPDKAKVISQIESTYQEPKNTVFEKSTAAVDTILNA